MAPTTATVWWAYSVGTEQLLLSNRIRDRESARADPTRSTGTREFRWT
jgi:hypothetical protein